VALVFGLDFAGRWFSSSKDSGKHVLNAQFALDVAVVIFPLLVGLTPASFWEDTPLPSWLTSPSGLFNLELLRVLRLRRVLKDMSTFERFAVRALLGTTQRQTVKRIVQEWQLQLARVLLSLFTLVSVATGLVYTAEHSVNPAINNYFDALFFGVTTLATVGFGDITGSLPSFVISESSWSGGKVDGSGASGTSLPPQFFVRVFLLSWATHIRLSSHYLAGQTDCLRQYLGWGRCGSSSGCSSCGFSATARKFQDPAATALHSPPRIHRGSIFEQQYPCSGCGQRVPILWSTVSLDYGRILLRLRRGTFGFMRSPSFLATCCG